MLDADELAQAMKDKGLGTPATRASIIETLISRQYIVRKGKALLPTEKGIRLIDAIPVESLRSPQLTGEWEAHLAQMSRGEYPEERFMEEVRAYVREIVARVKVARPIENAVLEPQVVEEAPAEAAPGKSRKVASKGGKAAEGAVPEKPARAKKGAGAAPEEVDTDEGNLGRCPRCQGKVLSTGRGYQCQNVPARCAFALKPEIAGKALTASMVKRLLSKGRTTLLKGFVSPRSGVRFDATLILKPEGGIGFEFEPRAGTPEKSDTAPQSSGKKRKKSEPAGGETGAPALPLTASKGQSAPTPVPMGRQESVQQVLSASSVDLEGAVIPDTPGGTLGLCPLCRQGQVIAGRQAWGCSRWREGCRLRVPFECFGMKLSARQARFLLRGGRLGQTGEPGSDAGPGVPQVVLVLSPETNHCELRLLGASGGG
jgi:hypothetical protein